jgi:ribosome-binding protein aMBF1 (putative translation factor)
MRDHADLYGLTAFLPTICVITHMPEDETTPSHRIGQRIREERRRQGLSQEQLALAANVATRSLHRVETGQRTVNFDVLVRILDALGLEIQLSRRIDRI